MRDGRFKIKWRFAKVILAFHNDIGIFTRHRNIEFLPLALLIHPDTIYQSALPSNWFEFSGVIPFVASNLPKGESTLIFPLMNG